MKNNQTISVCMAVFSHSKYLKEQLDSIVYQSKKIDELIIIEDFSGQNSPKQYIETTCFKNNIKLHYKICEKNIGPAESFRQAILASSSDIIFLSDHDDIWLKHRIEKAMKSHHNNDFVVVNGDEIKINSNGKLINNYITDCNIYNDLKINLFNMLLKNKVVGATISFRGDTARYIALNIKFYPMHDWTLAIAFLVLNKRIKFIDECLIQYRRHEGTFTGNKKTSFLKKCKYRVYILYSIYRVFMLK
jgi:glycosyltransferase involved in cell wall biosynthesis